MINYFIKIFGLLYPTQTIQYFANLKEHFKGFGKLRSLSYKDGWNWHKYFWVYLFDVGASVFTGGSPWETLSSRFQKDRQTFLAKVVLGFIELFDKNHGKNAYDHFHGEETNDNRELSNNAQTFLAVFWLVVIILLFSNGITAVI